MAWVQGASDRFLFYHGIAFAAKLLNGAVCDGDIAAAVTITPCLCGRQAASVAYHGDLKHICYRLLVIANGCHVNGQR
jgi:hypothetical protein